MSSTDVRIRVWDLPTRIFHWTLAGLVIFSFTTGKVGGGWMEWHLRSGYAILALLVFRLAWGFAGSRTARFAHFLRGPRAALAYARETIGGAPSVYRGTQPAGRMDGAFMLLVLARAGFDRASSPMTRSRRKARSPPRSPMPWWHA